jgi:Na+:H+ antiporter, NhaA family
MDPIEGAPGSLVGRSIGMPDTDPSPSSDAIRVPWGGSDRPLPRRVVRPLQEFLSTATAGATLLLVAATAALLWANSPWGDAYRRLWATELGAELGSWSISMDLRHWMNDGLMALFFLVVGLEIKRELLTGELRDRRQAALPIIAALGGMVVPAVLFITVTAGGTGSHGWGIPMATDIAFALGVLTLAARHAPANVKPFLLTLAIVDDIGAILVIALVYSGGLTWGWLGAASVVVIAIVVLRAIHVRAQLVYVVLGVVLWVCTFESGVHPTIAGVVMGLLTPAVPFQRPRAVSAEAVRASDETQDDPDPPDADAPQWLRLASLSREAVSPLARVEHLLWPWTSFVIVPLFALANAGVELSVDATRAAASSTVTLGVIVGLVAGKTIGISAASWLAVRVGVGRLPGGVRWLHLVGTAAVAGIGFTVSLFVADLAFDDGDLVAQAKVGILAASLVAGTVGYLILRRSPPTVDGSTLGDG